MDINNARTRVQKSLDYFETEIGKTRGTRANPSLLEDVRVEVYGSVMPLVQVGSIGVVDPTLMVVNCWDKSNVEAVKKAIESADLNLNPSIDGSNVKVPLPPLSEERREELVRVVKKMAEEARISIRNIRKDLMEELKKESLSEDDEERAGKDVQKIVDEFNDLIGAKLEDKEKELLTI